jgi:AraC-like DNA-binding protein
VTVLGGISGFDLDTSCPGEALRVHRAERLPGLELWTLASTTRPLAMVHDSFGALLVRGRPAVVLGRCWSRGRESPLMDGSVLLFEPGESSWTSALFEPADLCLVLWEPAALAPEAAAVGVPGALRWATGVPDPGCHGGSFARLWSLLEADAGVDVEYTTLTRCLVAAAGEVALTPRRWGVSHAGVQRALAHLVTHASDGVQLDALALAARLSKFHLVRCFREATGFAPHRYQMLLRLCMARRLVERGASTEAAAARAGFSDGAHLCRAFRAWLGVAPGAWGRAYRAIDPRGSKRTLPPPPALASARDLRRESA